MDTGALDFTAISMDSPAYCGVQVKTQAAGLRWLSRSGNFGSEIVTILPRAGGDSVRFTIGRHNCMRGRIDAPTGAQRNLVTKLADIGILHVNAAN